MLGTENFLNISGFGLWVPWGSAGYADIADGVFDSVVSVGVPRVFSPWLLSVQFAYDPGGVREYKGAARRSGGGDLCSKEVA